MATDVAASPAVQPPVSVLPFNASAREHTEQAFDVSVVPGAATQEILQGNNQSIPAEGFLRSLWIEITGSGGVAGTFVPGGDAPWSLIQRVVLSDVNGAPIYGPVSGFDLYLANKYGGYMFRADPAAQPDAVLTTPNMVFALRIPLEINRQTGFGCLGNQNASSTYKVQITLNTIAAVWSVPPAPVPTFRFRGFIETWTQPFPQDAVGRPQATLPPGYGTTQYWTKTQYPLNGGQQNIQLTRVGNLIRALVLVIRDAEGLRVSVANTPDMIELDWDARMTFRESRMYRRNLMVETFAAQGPAINGPTQIDPGVLVYNLDRTILGHTGGGATSYYYPTVQSTRLQWDCVWPVAGQVEVLTNDVAPFETNQAARWAEGSNTGFHPQVGTPIPGSGA